MSELGDVNINGKWYRVDLESYRCRDIVDFSPRASTPGSGMVLSDLMLYQPLMQTDWRHGFGFQSYVDAEGYQRTVGNVDTRHEGLVMLYTDKVQSDTGNFRKTGATMHKNVPYFWGEDGIRRHTNGVWTTISPNPVTLDTITNNGFETYSSSVFTGWSHIAGHGTISQTTTVGQFYAGLSACKLTCGAVDNTAIKQTLTVIPGAVYTLSFYSRTDDTHGAGNYSIYDATHNADIVEKTAVEVAPTPTNFIITTKEFTVPADCISISIIFYPNSVNTSVNYFDEVSLKHTNKPPDAVNMMLSLGENLFAVPREDRIMRTVYSGEIKEQPSETSAFDTYLDENKITTNYKTDTSLVFGSKTTANKSTHIIIKPPISNIPVGATLTEVTLTLYCSASSGTVPDVTISRLLSTGITEEGATWKTINGTANWNTDGGTGSGTDISATPLCAVSSPNIRAGSAYTFTLDPTEFNNFITGNNTGMLIYETNLSPVGKHSATFSSSADANTDRRPYFTYKYSFDEDWEDAGTNENSKDYHWMEIFNGYVYAGVRNTNRVHYSSSDTLADIEGGIDDPGLIKIGAGSYPTLGAIGFLGSLYIARPDGLWQLGEDKIARRTLDFSSEVSDLNFNSMCVHNGYLIFPVRDVIYQWNGSRLTRITPEKISNTWPYITYGKFSNFCAIGDFLYCTGRTNEATYTESLLCYDGVGWHKLCDLITNGIDSTTLVFFDTSNNYLWVHISGESQTTYYIPLQGLSSFPYPNFPTSGTHSLYSCIHDMGFARITKSSPSLLVEAENVTTTTYLTVYYSTDGKEWVKWGRIVNDGVTELTMPGGLRTQEYKTIQIRTDFTTSIATESPILLGLTLRFLMRPEVSYGWNFNIMAADHFVYGEREDVRTADIIIQDIKEARDSKSPVKFVDLAEREFDVYISAYSETAQERNDGEENRGVPSIESVVNVNVVEAK